MNDDDVGYCKPPKHTRFRKGICPNPKGRGQRKENPHGDVIEPFLNAKIAFREGGKLKRATRAELTVRRLVTSALNGNVKHAAQLLTLLKAAQRNDTGPLVIQVIGGLPDDYDPSAASPKDDIVTMDGICFSSPIPDEYL